MRIILDEEDIPSIRAIQHDPDMGGFQISVMGEAVTFWVGPNVWDQMQKDIKNGRKTLEFQWRSRDENDHVEHG